MSYAEELRFRQNRFCTHISWLISFIQTPESGLTISFGRAYDLPEVQPILVAKGLSSTLDSMHPKRLAIDLNFFKGDYRLFSDPLQKDKDFGAVELAGEYFESLHPENTWGGRWKTPFDPFHFEHTFR